MTVEVSDQANKYIPVEKFKDDIVARYDILLSEDFSRNKLLYFKRDEFDKADKYLAHQLTTVGAKSFAITNLKDKDGKIFGAIVCLSTDKEYINLLTVRELSLELEDIFNKIILEYEHKK